MSRSKKASEAFVKSAAGRLSLHSPMTQVLAQIHATPAMDLSSISASQAGANGSRMDQTGSI
ncbi:MAG: hypothetical protein IV112_21395 [Methyloversatilis discipulorum]|nr:hypothetical protein [Methyloversatilis discipulorum]